MGVDRKLLKLVKLFFIKGGVQEITKSSRNLVESLLYHWGYTERKKSKIPHNFSSLLIKSGTLFTFPAV